MAFASSWKVIYTESDSKNGLASGLRLQNAFTLPHSMHACGVRIVAIASDSYRYTLISVSQLQCVNCRFWQVMPHCNDLIKFLFLLKLINREINHCIIIMTYMLIKFTNH